MTSPFQGTFRLNSKREFITHVLFCSNFSSVFATASYGSVRVWSLTKKQELLRIIVPNFTATAVLFAHDGQSILTAWDDGVIRAFTPITGKLIYAIPNAHNKGHQIDMLESKCNVMFECILLNFTEQVALH